MNQMTPEDFKKHLSIIRTIAKTGMIGKRKINDERLVSVKQAYKTLINSEKGIELKNIKQQLALLKESLSKILKGNTSLFRDKAFMQLLPDAFNQLIADGKDKVVKAIIDKMGECLTGSLPSAQNHIVQALAGIGDRMAARGHLDITIQISHRLTQWIISDSKVTAAYEKAFVILQDLTKVLIRNDRIPESIQIIVVFKNIYTGKFKKGKSVENLAAGVLKGIAENDILSQLLSELRTEDVERRENAMLGLIYIGKSAVPGLMDVFIDCSDESERAMIVQVISQIGPEAVPFLIKRIDPNGSLDHLRIIIDLIGNLGDAKALASLKSLLEHKDEQVKKLALQSIYTVSGDNREEILVSILAMPDVAVKIDTITMLGALKSQKAVSVLLDMLTSKSLFASTENDNLKEKICVALGDIGSMDAEPSLKSIVEKKGFLKIKSINPKIKNAAAMALQRIQQSGKR